MATQLVECPSCQKQLPLTQLNPHLDQCLSDPAPKEASANAGTKRSSPTSPSAAPLKRPKQETDAVPSTSRSRVDAAKPFAERMRPQSLDEYVGQSEIVNGPLKMLLRQGRIPSMILWGPPGTGKTTLARLLAKSAGGTAPHRFVEISATNAGTADVKKIMDDALHRLQLTGQRTLLFIDEIQRFTRAQQDVFLPTVEKGQIVLVAATTENPSFRLQGALISRMRVFVLTKLSVPECSQVLQNALKRVKEEDDSAAAVDEELIQWISNMADGDARTALSALELALSTTDPSLTAQENLAQLKTALKRTALQYDRTGDMHYDTISALHKSIRGSDPDAALYWLARMVCSGDDPLFIARRLIVAASEDIDTLEALQMATATYQACQVVGLPECGENLAQCVVFLAERRKSTRSYRAWKRAKTLVQESYNYPVPLHIRNAPTKLMKDLDYGKEYHYPPRFCHPIHQAYLPREIIGTRLLSPPPEETAPDEEQPDYHHDSMQKSMDGKTGIGPGSCQRIFELGARAVDLDLLDEWETLHNEGREWSGRKKLMAQLAGMTNGTELPGHV